MKGAPLFWRVCIFFVVLTSCEKETRYPQPQPQGAATVRLHPYLTNPEDPEDEQMNDLLYLFAKGLSSFSDQQRLMTLLGNNCQTNEECSITYEQLIAADSSFYRLMNAWLKANSGAVFADQQFNYVRYCKSKMVRGALSYSPNITVLNATVADWNLRPVVCLGVSCTDEDAIVGFRWSADGETLVTITETTALTEITPVIIVNNRADGPDLTVVQDAVNDYASPQTVTAPTNYNWESCQIKAGYRYENGGPNNRSELNFMVTMHNNTTFLTNSSLGFTWGQNKGQIAKVHVNDINNSAVLPIPANAPLLFAQNLPVIESNQYTQAYITTYEYDWYAAAQEVDWCFDNVSGFIYKKHYCRMKYADQWYYQTLCSYHLTGFMPAVNFIAGFGGQKSSYQLKRTN